MRFLGIDEFATLRLLGGAALVLVLLFFLRGRRRRLGVGTAPVWERLLGRQVVDLRALLALLVELLVAAALCFTLAEPVTGSGRSAARRALALVLDAGATMQARDGDRSRLDRAVDLARELIDGLPPDEPATLVRAGPEPAVLTRPGTDRAALRAALGQIEADDRTSDPLAAVHAACQLLQTQLPRHAAQVIYLGDGQAPEADLDGCRVLRVPVGRPVGNLSLDRFDARRSAGFGRGYELFVEVHNHGARERAARLVVFSPAATLGIQEIVVPGHATVTRGLRLDEEGGQEGQLTALLQNPTGGPVDGFPRDDAAYALIPRGRRARVLLVSPGNLFLEKGLTVNPAVKLTTVPPTGLAAELAAAQGRGEPPDAVVLDGVPPGAELPYPALLFGPAAAGSTFPLEPAVATPEITDWNPDHPLLRGVRLSGLHIQQAYPLRPRADDAVLAGCPQGGLLVAREQDGRQQLAVAFALTASDLPLRVAFPVLLANFVDWSVKAETEAPGRGVSLGQAEPLLAPGERGPVRIRGPGGEAVTPLATARGPALRADRAGFYEVTRPAGTLLLHANFDRLAASQQVVRGASPREDEPESLGSLPASVRALRVATASGSAARDWTQLLLACGALLAAALWMGHGVGLLR